MNRHYFMSFVICALLFSSLASFAQSYKRSDIEVGKQPAFLFTYNSELYAFCIGYDANFNGIYDEETDEKPSLWRISVPDYEVVGKSPIFSEIDGISVELVRHFNFNLPGFPLRPALFGNHFYFHQNGFIYMYNVVNGDALDSIPFDHSVYGLNVHKNKLYVSARVLPEGAWVPEDNYVVIIDLDSRLATDTIPAEMNVQMTRMLDDDHILILNEGLGSGDDSFVKMVNINKVDDAYNIIDSFSAGSFGNYFVLDNSKNSLYIVSNGSHKVIKYNIYEDNQKPIDYQMPSFGYDGPRELLLNEYLGTMLVSAYDGKVYTFNLDETSPTLSFEGKGKTEALAMDLTKRYFAFTNISNFDYSPNNQVTILQQNPLSVEQEHITFNIYPNPASEYIILEATRGAFENAKYSIYSIDGNLISSYELDINDNRLIINLADLNLVSGTYLLKISKSFKESVFRFTVNK